MVRTRTTLRPKTPDAPARQCPHTPPCPPADRSGRLAARIVAAHPGQGWHLLYNGIVIFDDSGYLLTLNTPAPQDSQVGLGQARAALPGNSSNGNTMNTLIGLDVVIIVITLATAVYLPPTLICLACSPRSGMSARPAPGDMPWPGLILCVTAFTLTNHQFGSRRVPWLGHEPVNRASRGDAEVTAADS